jgi:hypothetical protein
MNPLALSGVDLANILSRTPYTKVTPAAIVRWVSLGCPRNNDRTYSLVNVAAWLHSKYAERPRTASAESDEEKKESIGLKRERRLAVRQARLANAKKLVDREEVREEWMARLHALKSGLLTLSRVLVREVVGQPAPVVQKVVDDRVNDVLWAYAQGWDGEGDIPVGENSFETETRPDHDASD